MKDEFTNRLSAFRTSLDCLVEQFQDKTFVADYYATRTVRDLGHGPGTPAASPT